MSECSQLSNLVTNVALLAVNMGCVFLNLKLYMEILKERAQQRRARGAQ